MRRVCRLAADTLLRVRGIICHGITTQNIDEFVVEDTKEKGCTAAQLGYVTPSNHIPFPKSVCTSINEVACHGIPGQRVLVEGDIINVDVTHVLDGWHGDCSATFRVGEVDHDAERLISAAHTALAVGISIVKPNVRLGDIGASIERAVKGHGMSIIRDYTGHGIGRQFHMEPLVPHHGQSGRGPRLKAGMVFTIEPIVSLGSSETHMLDDGWTVVSSDSSLSAQFEHTVLVTEDGYEILTLP